MSTAGRLRDREVVKNHFGEGEAVRSNRGKSERKPKQTLALPDFGTMFIK
jgi:hypothetical protein